MVQVQDSRVRMAILSIHIFDGLIAVDTYEWLNVVMEEQHFRNFACRMNLTKASIKSSWCFSTVSMLPP